MQTILRGGEQQRVDVLTLTSRQHRRIHGGRQQAHARHIVHGILERQLARQRLACLFGGQLIIRHEHGGGQIVGNAIVDGMEALCSGSPPGIGTEPTPRGFPCPKTW